MEWQSAINCSFKTKLANLSFSSWAGKNLSTSLKFSINGYVLMSHFIAGGHHSKFIKIASNLNFSTKIFEYIWREARKGLLARVEGPFE